MSSRLGGFTSKSNKYFTSWPTQPQVLKASKYVLATQMLSNKGFTQLNSKDSTLITQIS